MGLVEGDHLVVVEHIGLVSVHPRVEPEVTEGLRSLFVDTEHLAVNHPGLHLVQSSRTSHDGVAFRQTAFRSWSSHFS
jgi:hypothetical protein